MRCWQKGIPLWAGFYLCMTGIGQELREFKRAIELDNRYAINHSWYALFLSFMGRFEEATLHSNRSLELEPVSVILNSNSIAVHYFKREYDDAIKQGLKAVEMDPNFYAPIGICLLGTMAKECGKK